MNAEAVPTSLSFLQVIFFASIGALAAHGMMSVFRAVSYKIFPDPKEPPVKVEEPAPGKFSIPTRLVICDRCGMCLGKSFVRVTRESGCASAVDYYCPRCANHLADAMRRLADEEEAP